MFLAAMFFLSLATAWLSMGIAFWLYNCLVALEYDRYPEQWVRDGRPPYFMWYRRRPPGARSMLLPLGKFVMAAVSLRWLLRTPASARQDEQAKWLLRDFRIAHAISLYGTLMTLLTIGLALSLAA